MYIKKLFIEKPKKILFLIASCYLKYVLIVVELRYGKMGENDISSGLVFIFQPI